MNKPCPFCNHEEPIMNENLVRCQNISCISYSIHLCYASEIWNDDSFRLGVKDTLNVSSDDVYYYGSYFLKKYHEEKRFENRVTI